MGSKRRIIILLLIFAFVATSFTGIHSPIGIASASAPGTPLSSGAYINATFSGYSNSVTGTSGTETLSQVENSTQSTVNFYNGNDWSISGLTATSNTISLKTPFYYWDNSQINLYGLQWESGTLEGSISGTTYYWISYENLAITLTINGHSDTYTRGYNTLPGQTSIPKQEWIDVSPTFSFNIANQVITSASLQIVQSAYSGEAATSWYSSPFELFTYAGSSGTFGFQTSNSAVASIPWEYGWNYAGNTGTISEPSGIQAMQFSFSSSYSLIASGGGQTTPQESSGTITYSASPPTEISFSDLSPDPSASTVSVSWSTSNVVISSTATSSDGPISYTYNENGNWWNATLSGSPSPPSSLLNGASVDGATWNTELTTYTVQHILSVGYGTSPAVDIMQYSGSSSGSFNPPTQYESWSGTSNNQDNSGTVSLSFNVAEFINYQPNTPTITTSYSGSGSTANVQVITGEQITGEHENVLINWGDGQTTPLNNVAFGTQPIKSHTYTGTYQGSFSQTYSPSDYG